MSSDAQVGVAAFVVDQSGARLAAVRAGPRVRAASVVKPLLFWVSAEDEVSPAVPGPAWRDLAQPAITESDNEATAALWSRAGQSQLLVRLERRAGVTWNPARDGEHASLRLMVTAAELGRAYSALALDDTAGGHDVRQWMREVRADQTFGSRSVASAVVVVAESSVGVKCGWFGAERAHAVVLADLGDRFLGGAVMTSWNPTPDVRRAASAAPRDDRQLIAVH